MSTPSFLAILPAILAILGFVIVRFFRADSAGSSTVDKIVGKLSAEAPEVRTKLKGLTARQASAALDQDHELRMLVGERNFELLKHVAYHQFLKSVLIYGIIALLFIVGIVAFVYVETRPKPLSFSNWALASTHPNSNGIPVDLDELLITWTATGPSRDIHVVLENVQSSRRTREFRVASSEQKLNIGPPYHEILSVRAKGKENRVRIIARSDEDTYISPEFELHVGIEIFIAPVEEDQSVVVSAMIDNWALQNYSFEGMLLVDKKENPIAPDRFGDEFTNPQTVFEIENFDEYNWLTAEFLYFGPDPPELVRQRPIQM